MSNVTALIGYPFFFGIFVSIIILFTLFFKRLYKKSSFLQQNSSFLQTVLSITIFSIGLVFGAGLFFTRQVENIAQEKLEREATLTCSFLKTAVDGELGKTDAAVKALQNSPWISNFLQEPSSQNLQQANAVLDRYCAAFKTSVAYILDTNGVTLASSNRNTSESFVNHNFSFRPYFSDARKGAFSSYFAAGINTNKPGYYSSAPLKNRNGNVIGIITIKDGLDVLDSIFSSAPFAFLTNSDGIIFVSSVPEYRFKSMFPISDSMLGDFYSNKQFGNYIITPLNASQPQKNEIILNKKNFLVKKIPIQVSGWYVTLFYSTDSIYSTRLTGFMFILAIVFCILITISMISLNRVKQWADTIYSSEKLFQSIFENAPEAIIVCEIDTGFIISGNSLAKTWFSAFDIFNKKPISEILFPALAENPITLPLSTDKFNGLFKVNINSKMNTVSASNIHIHFNKKPCILLFLKDVTAILETSEALEKSEQKYRELTEFLPQAVFEADTSSTFTYVNDYGLQTFGYTPEDLRKGIAVWDILVPEELEKAKTNLKIIIEGGNPNNNFEYMALHKNGKHFPIMVHTSRVLSNNIVTGIRGTATDITERKEFEAELQRTDKLEALGILAGGIAHDFNNLLTAIWAGISLLKIKIHSDTDAKVIIQDTESALKRGKELTAQLLTYSKGGAPIKVATSLINIVKETASFTTTGTNVRCDFTLDNNLYPVEIDSIQISQVIQNLLLNSIEAMGQGGIIDITLRNHPSTQKDQSSQPMADYIELIVSDTGCGIPEEIQNRIYDPFFSTKSKGSGLGLATAHSIIKNHNGQIFFESAVGKGTTFHILLPATAKKIPAPPKTESIVVKKSDGNILLMDDEAIIRNVTEKLLSHLGYTVTTTATGEETLKTYVESIRKQIRFDLVILDLTIPGGMGGKETIGKLLEIDPQVKALVSSGYSNDPIMAKYSEYGFAGIISKPYNIAELNQTIQTIISSGKTS